MYAVISHVGGGPNSGHYYAHVKGPDGIWYDANDESVIRTTSSAVVGRKNAYMLFYMRMQGDALGAAISLHRVNGMKKGMKRKTPEGEDEDEDEDRGVVTNGTVAPVSSPQRQNSPVLKPHTLSPRPDPHALKLQGNFAKVGANSKVLSQHKVSLVPYSSDGEDEEDGQVREAREAREATPGPLTSSFSSPRLPPSSSSVALGARSSSPIESPSFPNRTSPKKRKGTNDGDDGLDYALGDSKRRRSSPPSENYRRDKQLLSKRALTTPFTSAIMNNNLHEARGGPSHAQGNGFNPPRRVYPQQIANVGRMPKVFHPRANGFAAGMKRKRRPMI